MAYPTDKPNDTVEHAEAPVEIDLKESEAIVDAASKGQATSGYENLTPSIMPVGQAIGMTTLPFISSPFDRKTAMYCYWFILALSVITEPVARTWPVWLVAKLLAGIGVGCLQSTLPVYVAEMAPLHICGGLLMCCNFWWTVGTFCAQVSLNTLNQAHEEEWMVHIYTQWAQIALMLIIYIFLHESPVWCVGVKDYDRARRLLNKLYRGVEGFDIEQQLQVLILAAEHEIVASEQRHISMTANGAAITCVVGIVMNILVPYMVDDNKRSAAELDELDELFERKIKAWKFHKTETAIQRLINIQNQL
ncbi:hypothetical protein FSARC_13907 [Fusarium sarcochroum]|uniref:Major facilitator superfamily (MFS) profile domain-containing protein n=1 Tax=Fusarium sarcochroum TaxID=1208366 RepID=A0A8H4WRX2_9HYPO|nr:hypothetical protein FSARC_13907 [Fusarium sarcochroum]